MKIDTSVHHADLHIDMYDDGTVHVTRQSNAMSIQLTKSEMNYIVNVLVLHNWPIAAVKKREEYDD